MLKPAKPPFAIQSYNRIFRLIGSAGSINLDKILKKGRKNTGLSDLGDDFNDEALLILVKSINEEAQLNPFGQLMIREKLIGQLESRLWATHWFKKYPEILEQDVLPIVLITGLQRTGTTKMQRLLSELPEARALFSWEALYPAPIGQFDETRKRIARTKRNEKVVKWISPTFQSIHPIFHDQPEEDVLLLDVHFMSSSLEAIMHVPSYARWLNSQNQTEVYAYEKKLLKLLQWQRGGRYWVLKSPHHLEYIDSFNRVFPDTRAIWTHRSTVQSVPSFLSMLYYSRSMFSDHVDKVDIKIHWLNKLADMLHTGLKFRSESPAKITDVTFSKFMQAENEIIAGIARKHPIKLDDLRPDKINSKEKYVSKHNYQLSDWDLTEDDLKRQFHAYEDLVTNLEES